MVTFENVSEQIKKISKKLTSFGVQKIGVFGSVVRGEQKNNSDIDFLVEFKPECLKYDNYISVSFLLEDTFDSKIDLVTNGSLSPHIGPYILAEVKYLDITS